jgi:succinyl-CoA synthetase beta subunit
MNIHEYQAKQLFRDHGINVPDGEVAFTAEQAEKAAKELGGPVWVVKAQIHAGGRGKAGGVKIVKSTDEVRDAADELLGSTLVTHQTGPDGQTVGRVYIEDGCDIDQEFYLSILIDRETQRPVIMASTEGGVDIEEVAEQTPEKITKVTIDPAVGLQPHQQGQIGFALGVEGDTFKQLTKMLKKLTDLFEKTDASILEINPLVITGDGDVIALDGKMTFDENALFRHPHIEKLRDETEEDPVELQAKELGLSYVNLDGNIGCMVNGAGLAMATMDIIKLHGMAPANFLDVGGSATKERVTEAFKLILSDPNVEAILVNIFGGIMRCDVIAEGILAAAKEIDLNVPLVVRLAGTKVNEGRKLLEEADIELITAEDLNDAADKVTTAAQQHGKAA